LKLLVLAVSKHTFSTIVYFNGYTAVALKPGVFADQKLLASNRAEYKADYTS
jgi:hypothetical protein